MHVQFLHFLELIWPLDSFNTVYTVNIGLQEKILIIIYYSILYRAVFTKNACFSNALVHCEFYAVYWKYLYKLTFHTYVLLII